MAALFESKAFKSWKQARDYELKAHNLVLGRLDNLAKQVHGLGKLLSGR